MDVPEQVRIEAQRKIEEEKELQKKLAEEEQQRREKEIKEAEEVAQAEERAIKEKAEKEAQEKKEEEERLKALEEAKQREEERKSPSPPPSPPPSPIHVPITITETPITVAPTIIVIHPINGDRVEVPTSLPIEDPLPSPTITTTPISIIETTTSTSTEPAHTTPGPQLESTIPVITTVETPLTVTTLITDPLTKQVKHIEEAGTSRQVEEEAEQEVQIIKEPSTMHEAAQMAQWYMSHMLSKAQEMQDEETNLHEELGHLELALEDERSKFKKVEAKLQAEITRNYEITKQLDLSNGKVMGYQTQLTEMQYRINQLQKDHAQEIEKINWQSSANLKVKDLQIEAM